MKYTIYQKSPVWSPDNLVVEAITTQHQSGCFYLGVYDSVGEAYAMKLQLLAQTLQKWADDSSGTPCYAHADGERYPAPSWFAQFGYAAYLAHPEAEYWSVAKIDSPTRA